MALVILSSEGKLYALLDCQQYLYQDRQLYQLLPVSSSTKLKCCEPNDAKSPSSWDFQACKQQSYLFGLLYQLSDYDGRNDEGSDVIEVEIGQMLCEWEERPLREGLLKHFQSLDAWLQFQEMAVYRCGYECDCCFQDGTC